MSKYNIFDSDEQEKLFWDGVFSKFFKNYDHYTPASREDDNLYGVDVWLKRQTNPISVGVQLKTSRDSVVNVHYYMECKTNWKKPLGINIYVTSNKLDYFIYAYPTLGYAYGMRQSDIKLFWEVYQDQLSSQNLKEYPSKYNGDCWKYYFQISSSQFETMCQAIKVEFNRRLVSKI